jgi:hypothetical protein
MGCDIHFCIEKKINNKWVMVCRDNGLDRAGSRNYIRFGKLAGVRTEGPDPKGIPDDISESSKLFIDEWGEDGHSHSYLPITEAAKIFLETEWPETLAEMGEWARANPASYFFDLEDYRGPLSDYRLVFFFDN